MRRGRWLDRVLGRTMTAIAALRTQPPGGPAWSWRMTGTSPEEAERLRTQSTLFDAAINHMTHGLCVFDRHQRLVASNRQYAEMYCLTPDQVQPGMALRDIVYLRRGAGGFPALGAEDYLLAWRGHFVAYKPGAMINELVDGRIIKVRHRPLPDGGWVATHEDITEQRKIEKELALARAEAERAEKATRAAHLRLKEAFEMVPEAFALMDADNRFVFWNDRYVELYPHLIGHIAVGMKFEDAIRIGVREKAIPEAIGREAEWLRERLAQHHAPRNSLEREMANGRWVRIEERRTADGGSIGIRVDITDLKRREASIRLLFEGNPLPMYVYDTETLKYLAVNDAAIRHYGYSRDQFLAMTLRDTRPQDEGERGQQRDRIAGDSDQAREAGRHRRADGTVFDAEVYARALDYQGHPAAMAVVIDITERKRAEEEVRSAREFLNTIIDNVPVTIMVKNPADLRYILVNRPAEKLLGRSREEIIGRTPHELFSKNAADNIAIRDREVLRTGEPLVVFGEHSPHDPVGGPIVNSTKILVRDAQGAPQYLLVVTEDVTEQKRAEERIEHMAHHDPLTDLPNRPAFNAYLQSRLAAAKGGRETFAVLVIDIDRFKEVNDVFGHATGDALLCEVARRLRDAAGESFVARLGGDEFTLVTTSMQPDAMQALGERLLASTRDIRVEGQVMHANVSIGAAIFPHDGSDAITLLGNADAALYRAKAEGRGIIRYFDPKTDKMLRDRRSLQHDLHGALERGEFELEYQPQALISGEVIGFEALVRWRHPTRGVVSPAVFIPIAEESGQIMQLGEWILREACREAASWPRRLRIAVNLSPVQFQHGDLPALVHEVLLETGLAANRLEFEITEGVLISDFARGVAILRRLKALGARIAMDDFGTGYSSLSYLQSFPFDKIKIDRAFISNLDTNAQSVAIVRGVIGLGHGLNLPVIAEGVETASQREVLTREKCDEIQGYLVGRPLPIAEYAGLVGRAPPQAGQVARAS